jgi:undecaprenyl-diphosphatase
MHWLKALLFSLTLLSPLQAQLETTTETASKKLSYLDAVILGLVEGVTEYLPISSTGHLILTNRLLDLDADTPVFDLEGNPILVEDKTTGGVRPYTIGEAAYAYVIVIQAGAIVAVVLLYWRTILNMALGCIGRSESGRRLALNLIIAFLPAAFIGLLLDDWIESNLGNNIHAVAGALIVGAFVMLGVEHWRRRKRKAAIDPEDGPELHELSLKQSLMIGFIQCFAMWPGTSRSMATIVGGYLAGLSPKHAAEFSFLLGLITLTAASGYKFVSNGEQMLAALEVGPVLTGCLVAFVSAVLAVKWLVAFLSKHGLAPFAWYRIALAIAVFMLMGS